MTSETDRVQSGEQPLLAFVSSVMTPELEGARNVAEQALRGAPFVLPWLFETTPASSQEADESYLSKVRDADLVIWLAGAETSTAVEREIREAIAADRRVLAFVLPVSKRSKRTENLIAEVQGHTKYRRLAAEDDLRDELNGAIGDEIVRAMRGRPSLGRQGRLDQLGRASRARCVERGRAAGLERQIALDLADDPSVGAPSDELRPGAEHPVVVLCGEVGIGKSLGGERLHQEAIARSLGDVDAPIPVWLSARECAGRLQQAVSERCEQLGNPEVQGALIVVDGADESGPARAEELLGEARVLADTWPSTRCLISSRPFPSLEQLEEVRKIPRLTEEEARDLIARVAGRAEANTTLTWPKNLREAIRVPLFALLISAIFRGGEGVVLHSQAQVIEAAIARRLAVDDEETRALMRRLGLLVITTETPQIRASDLGSRDDVDKVLGTRLVSSRGDRLFFPLVIFAQWFAAETIAELEEVELEERVEDILRAPDEWRYPLAIFCARGSSAATARVMGRIARRAPAFASQVVEDAIARWGTDEEEAPIAQQGTAEELRDSMAAWVDGIGPLAPLIAPVDDQGELRPVATRADSGKLISAWYRGSEQRPPASELPPDIALFGGNYDWGPLRLGDPGGQASWAWRWSLESLRYELERLLKARGLRVEDGPIFESERYVRALKYLGRGSGVEEPLAVSDVAAKLAKFQEGTRDLGVFEPSQLIVQLTNLVESGVQELEPPFPRRDREYGSPGWGWTAYSDDRLLERTVAVYKAAMDGYSALVERWFRPFAPRLATAVLLPAVLRGILQPPSGPELHDGPAIQWTLEPLPSGEHSQVELELGQIDRTLDEETFERLRALYETARGRDAIWLPSVIQHEVLRVFDHLSAREFAYSWLWADLKRVGWVTGLLGTSTLVPV